MLQLPKTKRDPKDTEHLCKCRPVCKSRRREWKGGIQNTSAELLLERKPVPVCFKRWPTGSGTGPYILQFHNKNCKQRKSFVSKDALELKLTHCKKIYPNGPCPLFGRTRRITINERNKIHKPKVVRICQAPIDDTVDTPYLKYANMAHDIGAWGAVRACCAFCECGACCPCSVRDYLMHDPERAAMRRRDMRRFDMRVKTDHQIMRIMYDKM